MEINKEKILEIIAITISIAINLFLIILATNSKNIIYQISITCLYSSILILINTIFFRIIENKINVVDGNKDDINRTGNQ